MSRGRLNAGEDCELNRRYGWGIVWDDETDWFMGCAARRCVCDCAGTPFERIGGVCVWGVCRVVGEMGLGITRGDASWLREVVVFKVELTERAVRGVCLWLIGGVP